MAGSTLDLYDVATGRLVATQRVGGGGQATWNVASIASGTYVLSGVNAIGRPSNWTFEVKR